MSGGGREYSVSSMSSETDPINPIPEEGVACVYGTVEQAKADTPTRTPSRKLLRQGSTVYMSSVYRGDKGKRIPRLWRNSTVIAEWDIDIETGLIEEEDDDESEFVSKMLAVMAESQDTGSAQRRNSSLMADWAGRDIVQFSSQISYVLESEEVFKIEVMRLGNLRGPIKVSYATADRTSKAGEHYESRSGVLMFEDGEYIKDIWVPIIDHAGWNCNTEFNIGLHDPEDCALGRYLYYVRVKILNSHAFPSNAFQEDIKSYHSHKGKHGLEGISEWHLFVEYCKLNWSSAGVAWKTVVVSLCEQLNSAVLFLLLWISVYMVDTLFARGETGDAESRLLFGSKYHTAMIISLTYVIPYVLLYLWEIIKTHIDITGHSREFLQVALIQTSLEYAEESRLIGPPAELSKTIMDDAQGLAASYAAVIDLVGIIGRVVAMVLFIMIFQPDHVAICMILAVVLVLFLFITLRVKTARKYLQILEESNMRLGTLSEQGNLNHRILKEYHKRAVVNDMFTELAEDVTSNKILDEIVRVTNKNAVRLVTGVAIAIYIIHGAPLVFNRKRSLGIFLASIAILHSYLADAMNDFNSRLMIIVDAGVLLRAFTKFLNLPQRVLTTMKLHRHHRHYSNVLRAKAHPCNSDRMPIIAHDMGLEATSKGVTIFRDVNFAIPQGSLVAVTGPPNSGKKALIELLASWICPTHGHVFVPSHLRVLHVSREPVFMNTSMLDNLSLGLDLKNKTKADRQRVHDILKLMKLHDMVELIDLESGAGGHLKKPRAYRTSSQLDLPDRDDLESSGDQQSTPAESIAFKDYSEMRWLLDLTPTEKILLHLARALIANPEVLVLEKSLQDLHKADTPHILMLLKDHVEQRGLCMSESHEERARRRPRTVILSTDDDVTLEHFDSILRLVPGPEGSVVMHDQKVSK